MRSHNHNEAITLAAMPEQRIPVLMRCEAANRDGFTALSEESPSGLSVRRVPQDALRTFVDPRQRGLFERNYGHIPERERQRILYILGLADALTKRDTKAMREAVRRYVSDSEFQAFAWDEVRRSPLYELHSHLNKGLRPIRFVVWWAQGERRLAPGLLATDAAGALGALVFSRMGQPGGLGICQRQQCRSPFIRMRSKQKYCNYRCQTAAGMARFRAKSKRRL